MRKSLFVCVLIITMSNIGFSASMNDVSKMLQKLKEIEIKQCANAIIEGKGTLNDAKMCENTCHYSIESYLNTRKDHLLKDAVNACIMSVTMYEEHKDHSSVHRIDGYLKSKKSSLEEVKQLFNKFNNPEPKQAVHKDGKEMERYQKLCKHDDAKGCMDTAILYFKKEEYYQASKMFSKACNLNLAEACHNLGLFYKNGQGVPQDYGEAARLFEKACMGGDAEGCYSLGYRYLLGQGVPKNEQKAKYLFSLACDAKVDGACEQYKAFNGY